MKTFVSMIVTISVIFAASLAVVANKHVKDTSCGLTDCSILDGITLGEPSTLRVVYNYNSQLDTYNPQQ